MTADQEVVPSIVIPAHDEAANIGRLLTALAPLVPAVEIVVVANGCTDATVDIARAVAPWAKVVDRTEPGKPGALDAGDAVALTFPRLYLDADVEIGVDDVRRLFAALHGGLLAVAATPGYDTSHSSWLVRSHHAFWEALPTNRSAISGTNAMAVSAEGRARFGSWPDLIGDDYFLDGLFAAGEKARIPSAHVVRPASAGFADAVSRKARIAEGNAQVVAAGLRTPHSGGGAGGAAAALRANPALLVHLPAHAAITLATRAVLAHRRRNGTAGAWYRDLSRTGRN